MPLFLRKRQTEDSDGDLLRRYRANGDIGTLGELYERYMHLVYGVCLKYLEDREAAKDEVMNIFEKLVTAVPAQEIMNFRTWLYVVAKNHCLMVLRSCKSDSMHREAMLADPEFFMENSSEMHPMEEEEGMYIKKLEECIERLKEEQRRCIELFYYEGYAYRQISEKTGIEEGKVKSHIQNGKRNLRNCMSSE